jgi:large subunit ribosomal protein L4
MKVDVIDRENKKTEEFNIDEGIMAAEAKDDLIHDVLLAYQQNQHTGSSNTLTRAEVRGGGKKPWKQKGTGRARHGSIRSPNWKGGGVTFGPRPVRSRIAINQKGKKKVMAAIVARKLKANGFIILNAFELAAPKTKEVTTTLKALNLAGQKLLIITDKKDMNFIKATRNLRGVKVLTAKDINVYELMIHEKILMTKKAMEEMIRRIA